MQSKTPEKEQNDLKNTEQAEIENLSEEVLQAETEIPNSKSNVEKTEIEKVASFEDKINELNNKYLYAMAELDNTRKRHIKERSDLLKYSGETIARDLLEVLDDLERAAVQPAESDSSQVLEGINLIANRMRTLFERFGIKSEDSNGQMFDPKKHEALTVAPSSKSDSGKILQQVTKCYYYKDKLLRHGQVIVGSGEGLEDQEKIDQKA
jgi:molecular chaperone GrpE